MLLPELDRSDDPAPTPSGSGCGRRELLELWGGIDAGRHSSLMVVSQPQFGLARAVLFLVNPAQPKARAASNGVPVFIT